MIYRFEIFDRQLHEWYIDFTTKDIYIAEEYFSILLKSHKNDKLIIRIITQFDI